MKKKYNVDIKQAAKELGISINTIYARIKSGWDIEDALSVGYIPQKERIYNHKTKTEPVNIESCEKLKASLQRLNTAIDKLIQLKTVKKKIVLKDAGTDLRKLSEHFTKLSDYEKNHFDNYCGGFKVNILNRANKNKKEFKYNIIGTDGKMLRTNDKSEFLTFLRDIS